ncbi:DegT/DnrJ/EryC1/StrS family aminotransferase [Bacteroidales bacterium OttesenSCG-928-B11]|nr:DegT/DnrJ/EryC1/StrS family aminotransferase [Bacteroidales bacterium OttesenSCG-928-E04]MDL2313052.1 DegT/DnrJ/EryC1/StrS family aminotransferase [Bacteroidales bacterium OttesenSCG-928-B11]MDL2326734.1 DegT/DnrJ/EryC1/StrS family aminotransferase [Bacteroidales bacterium OttesenSCG-928-A14]
MSMKAIQMVDLKSQYQKIKPEIDKRIGEVLESAAFINGSAVKSFQQNLEQYLAVKHVVPCGNGTDALQVALMALDLQPGDEVITTPFTFIATAEVVALLKLKTVFVDVDPDTFNMNPELIEQAITPKTKAIVPVHLFGQCCDMERIMEIAAKHNLYVIEDACQAIGADYTFKNGKTRKAGTIGQIGCTSFFPSKNLGCYGDGGAIFTNDDQLAEKMRGIVNHGMFVRYYHEMVGVNSRLDSIQAAVLDVKLPYLDEYNEKRRQLAQFYNKAFANQPKLTIPVTGEQTTHVFHQYTLKINGVDRETLIQKMNEAGIPVMIYYPVPLHLQKAFANVGGKRGDFPVTEALCDAVISLPMHSEMDEDQANHISTTLLKLV